MLFITLYKDFKHGQWCCKRGASDDSRGLISKGYHRSLAFSNHQTTMALEYRGQSDDE